MVNCGPLALACALVALMAASVAPPAHAFSLHMMATKPSQSRQAGKKPLASGNGRLARSKDREQAVKNPNKVMVSNIDFTVTQEELMEFCGLAGSVVDIKIVKDQWTKRSKGYGFVEYSLPLEATIAIEDLTGRQLKGRKVQVKSAFRAADVKAQQERERIWAEKAAARSESSEEEEEGESSEE